MSLHSVKAPRERQPMTLISGVIKPIFRVYYSTRMNVWRVTYFDRDESRERGLQVTRSSEDQPWTEWTKELEERRNAESL